MILVNRWICVVQPIHIQHYLVLEILLIARNVLITNTK